MERSIIKIKSMAFKYDKEYIFKDFDLDINPGLFVSIIGKNGSGKSTLAKILSGAYLAYGYITIDGYLLNNNYLKKIRRSLGVCFDSSEHFVTESVRNELAFTLENLEYSKEEIQECINSMAKTFKLQDILDKASDEISSSSKAKVAIASLLIHNPKIIILDEIIYKLNPSDKKLVFKVLKDYQEKERLTIILITNDLEDTLMSDRIILLDKGKIIQDGTKEEIYGDDKLEKLGFDLPFIVKLSHNLMLYGLLDKVYFSESEVISKLWR